MADNGAVVQVRRRARDVAHVPVAEPDVPEEEQTEQTEQDGLMQTEKEEPVQTEKQAAQEAQMAREAAGGLFGFLTAQDVNVLSALTFLAVVVRLLWIAMPPVTVFDEVHFGGFANKYLNGEFHLDVHPPLAKLLVTLSAWIFAFKGNFSFWDIGVDYRKHDVPYVGMRVFAALFGVGAVPLAYVALAAWDVGPVAAATGALLVLFENALATQSRLILLDAYLVFFTAGAVAALALWQRIDRQPGAAFTGRWWGALALTGAALGCAASSKWVGLFTVCAVGTHVLAQLWALFGDARGTPLRVLWRHVGARAACLIALPGAIYVGLFWVHLRLLSQYSGAVRSMTLEFQQHFAEAAIPPTNGPVYFGSRITLRQVRRDGGGYLHSHADLYPVGTKQQQVTVYHHVDSNNAFILRRAFVPHVTYSQREQDYGLAEEEEREPVRHGDTVRLEHANTYRFLHSHNEPAPVSSKKEHHCEVSGYGHHGQRVSDANDNWVVLLVGWDGRARAPPARGEKGRPIRAIRDRIVLLHPMAGCVLHAASRKLPEWGHFQGEVTCGREVLPRHTRWMIESNEHPLHADDPQNYAVVQRRATFLERMAELNGWMGAANAGLVGAHFYQSRPQAWLTLQRGCGFWNAKQDARSQREVDKERALKSPGGVFHDPDAGLDAEAVAARDAAEAAAKERLRAELRGRQIYLLGNLPTWGAVAWAVLSFAGLLGAAVLAGQRLRGAPADAHPRLRATARFLCALADPRSATGFLLVAWAWHYLPFFLIGRQLYLHHYLPALWCGILFLVAFMDRVTRGHRALLLTLCAGLLTAAVCFYWAYAPLAYGLPLEGARCEALKLRSGWDWDCGIQS